MNSIYLKQNMNNKYYSTHKFRNVSLEIIETKIHRYNIPAQNQHTYHIHIKFNNYAMLKTEVVSAWFQLIIRVDSISCNCAKGKRMGRVSLQHPHMLASDVSITSIRGGGLLQPDGVGEARVTASPRAVRPFAGPPTARCSYK